MAPELFIEELQLKSASINDLKIADIWSLGMVIFCIFNPDLGYPYEKDFEKLSGVSWLLVLQEHLRKNKKPSGSVKYRADIKVIKKILDEDAESGCRNILLCASQESAMTEYNELVAVAMAFGGDPKSVPYPQNNGGLSCSFLSLAICDELASHLSSCKDYTEFVDRLTSTANYVVKDIPSLVNSVRDMSRLYDVSEAYKIMKDNNIIKNHTMNSLKKSMVNLICCKNLDSTSSLEL